MTKRNSEAKTRVHLWLYSRDLERIDALFKGKLKRSVAICIMIRRVLDQIEGRAASDAEHLTVTEEDLALLDD